MSLPFLSALGLLLGRWLGQGHPVCYIVMSVPPAITTIYGNGIAVGNVIRAYGAIFQHNNYFTFYGQSLAYWNPSQVGIGVEGGGVGFCKLELVLYRISSASRRKIEFPCRHALDRLRTLYGYRGWASPCIHSC